MRSPVCLVCEDEALIALDLEVCLKDSGISVAGPFAASTDALAWIEGNTPDVAILDYRLSDGPCTPLVDLLRHRGVPLVMHSGWPRDGTEFPSDLSTLQWLPKPSPCEALLKAATASLQI